jgi:hypothetical protein
MGSVYSVLFWITGIIQTLIATFFLVTYGENIVGKNILFKGSFGLLMLASLICGLFAANTRPDDCETECDSDTYNQVFKNILVILSFLFVFALYKFDILEFYMTFSLFVLASIIILFVFYSTNFNNISCMCDEDTGNNLDTTKILFGVAGMIQLVIYALFLIPYFGNFFKTSPILKSIVGISLVISLILGLFAANRKPPECELEGRNFENTQIVMNTVAAVSFILISLLYTYNIMKTNRYAKIGSTIILVLCSMVYYAYATNFNGVICSYDENSNNDDDGGGSDNTNTNQILFGVSGLILLTTYFVFLYTPIEDFIKVKGTAVIDLDATFIVALTISTVLGLVGANLKPSKCDSESCSFLYTQIIMNITVVLTVIIILVLYYRNILENSTFRIALSSGVFVFLTAIFIVYSTDFRGVICMCDCVQNNVITNCDEVICDEVTCDKLETCACIV